MYWDFCSFCPVGFGFTKSVDLFSPNWYPHFPNKLPNTRNPTGGKEDAPTRKREKALLVPVSYYKKGSENEIPSPPEWSCGFERSLVARTYLGTVVKRVT